MATINEPLGLVAVQCHALLDNPWGVAQDSAAFATVAVVLVVVELVVLLAPGAAGGGSGAPALVVPPSATMGVSPPPPPHAASVLARTTAMDADANDVRMLCLPSG
ncbi:hypothetical protein ACPWT1_04375 [Ramlibacter sp. MMS24-I3-19]|uniref:hypothetical protein n=1 Tax=Ramlibacter sp. MMS24-I3-19 TaxID=3416606 RepID=UPI003D063A2D